MAFPLSAERIIPFQYLPETEMPHRENAAGSAPKGLSGRRAQAAANDERILEAAREVFVADPGAPIAAVAARAGVGISALYRRYASKDDLLRAIVGEGLARYIAEVEAALEGDPWDAFAAFMRRVVDADLHSLTQRLAGTFAPTEALTQAGMRAGALNARLFERLRGVIRDDLEVNDLSFLLEQIASVRLKDRERTLELRRRYLALTLAAMRSGGEPLPGPPPSWQDNAGRWTPT
jgi:AcrR family transcriptional regulator